MGVEFHVVQSVIPRSSFLPSSVGCWTFRGVLHFARVGTDGLLMRLLVLRVLCEGGRLYYNQLHPLSHVTAHPFFVTGGYWNISSSSMR